MDTFYFELTGKHITTAIKPMMKPSQETKYPTSVANLQSACWKLADMKLNYKVIERMNK